MKTEQVQEALRFLSRTLSVLSWKWEIRNVDSFFLKHSRESRVPKNNTNNDENGSSSLLQSKTSCVFRERRKGEKDGNGQNQLDVIVEEKRQTSLSCRLFHFAFNVTLTIL